MKQKWANIILIAGSGRNVGKTTFICQVLENLRNQQPIAIKISPHFHQPPPGLRILSENKSYQIFEETERTVNKDSSRYLQHGAQRSLYVQVHDENLADAFLTLFPFLDANRPILIESASLHKHIASGLFLFILNEESEKKAATQTNLKVADFVVISNGKSFSLNPDQVKFENEWKIIE